ncbi:MAG: DNA polymerase III subunit alpha [Bacteroidales bacterium]
MYLSVRSYYSLRYGVISINNLINKAKEYGLSALAITDINNTTGIVDFVLECQNNNIKPIGGIEFRNWDKWMYTGLAKNNEGFHQLNNFFSKYHLNYYDFPEEPPEFDNVIFILPFTAIHKEQLKENEYVGVRLNEISKLYSFQSIPFREKLLYVNSVNFINASEWDLHRHLRAIDHNVLLSHVKESWLASQDELFYNPEELKEFCNHFPFLLENADRIARQCHLHFDMSVKNKSTYTGNRAKDSALLRKLTFNGMKERYRTVTTTIKNRIKKELYIIDEMGLSAYFLVTRDVISYSMQQGFYHIGRGSGANSMVAYCLYITDVDPLELNLYFERFINPKRSSPPDFDIDYSWKDRDYVLDYIFQQFGYGNTALLGTISTFKEKSIIRELAKTYGLPKKEIDALIERPEEYINKDVLYDQIFQVSNKLVGFPNLRSIHAGGVLISDRPVTYYSALDLPPKGYPTTQWDMYAAERIGFEKLDILSQRGIGHIKESVEIIRENTGEDVDIFDIQSIKTDSKAKNLLRKGETTGCFYIESPAMRGLLKKLRCDDYLTLVAASSIIRPGVAKSGMMREYIRRFHHPGDFEYIHPVMREQLKETYGIMVYQEDVLKICHHFAGLDLADADILRRAMSGKFRSKREFKRIEEKFFSNCRHYGYSEKIIHEVWRQIESFAGYSFSKAHSASYAVESFQSLYLKAHFPLEFMTAVINNFGGYYRTFVYINEAQRYGASIFLPCVNNSYYLTNIYGKEIYLGFVHIKDFENQLSMRIVDERIQNGKYKGLEDFVSRTNIGKEQSIILIRAGCLRFTGKIKAELLWKVHMLFLKKNNKTKEYKLFNISSAKDDKLPEFSQMPLEDAYDEIELLGFPVTLSLFDMLKTTFRGEMNASEMTDNVGKTFRMVGQLVTIKYVRTSRKEIMNFATFLDTKGEFFDTVHFPKVLKQYSFRGAGVYLILGKIVEEFGFASLEVEKMAKLSLKPDPRRE